MIVPIPATFLQIFSQRQTSFLHLYLKVEMQKFTNDTYVSKVTISYFPSDKKSRSFVFRPTKVFTTSLEDGNSKLCNKLTHSNVSLEHSRKCLDEEGLEGQTIHDKITYI